MAVSEVQFGPSTTEQYVLLQLNEDLLHTALHIKPASATSTVLCTETSTYQLKDVQQSNSLLFLAPTQDREKLVVQGESASWLETTRIAKPRVVLDSIPLYNGLENSSGINRDILYSSIPASSAEIQAVLEEELCIDLGQGIVKLDAAYVTRLLRLLVNTIVSDGLELSHLTIQAVLQAMQEEDVDQQVLSFLFKRFSQNVDTEESNQGFRAMSSSEIVRYTGIATLGLSARAAISTSKFLALWSQATCAQYQALCKDLTILQGHYVQPVSTQIRHMSSSELSLEPKQRMDQLLTIKDRWTEAEISPFLEEIASGPKAIQSVLLKHAKRTKIGQTTFVERRVR